MPCMTAAITVLDIIKNKPVIKHIEKIGSALNEGIKKIIKDFHLENYVSF